MAYAFLSYPYGMVSLVAGTGPAQQEGATMLDLYDTPIAVAIDARQDEGHMVYIWGFSADGRRALIVDHDHGAVGVASVHATTGSGRWECSPEHLRAYSEVYAERFPRRA